MRRAGVRVPCCRLLTLRSEETCLDSDRLTALDEAIQRFSEAWAAGDAVVLNSLLSPTYTHTDIFGDFLERDAWLTYARGRATRTTAIAFAEVKKRIVGDVAIVTGRNDITGPGARNAADATDLILRFTQVWVWRDGSWIREAFQATRCARDASPAS